MRKELDATITNMLVADESDVDVDNGDIVVEDRFMDGKGSNQGIDDGERKTFLWYHLFQLLVVLTMMTALILFAVLRMNGMQNPTSVLFGVSLGQLWDNIAKLFYGTLSFFSSTEDAKSSRMSRKSFGSFKRSAKLFVMSISLLALDASESELVEEGVSEMRLIMCHIAVLSLLLV